MVDWLRRDRGAFEALAVSLGLDPQGSEAVGTFEGVPVRIAALDSDDNPVSHDNERWGCSVSMGARLDLPGFDVCPMNVFGQLNRSLGREIRSGDAGFDERVLVDGDELEIAATLDAPTRARLLELIAKSACLREGQVRLDRVRARAIFALLRHCVPLVADLRPVPSAERIARAARNAGHDPESGVRQRNATVLVRRAADAAEVQEMLSRALTDADPRVRLFAARHVVTSGGPAGPYRSAGVSASPAEALAELAGGSYDAAVRAEAIELFASRSDRPGVEPLLRSLLADGDAGVRRAASRALSKRKTTIR